MCIELKEVTKDNWIDCISLSLYPEQEGNLASNVDSIAESKFEPNNQLRAIYKDRKVIGFLAFCVEDDPPDPKLYWIFRFMIDKDFQGQGYGTKALNLVIDEIKKLGAKRIHTMHKPKNKIAGKLYQKIVFSYIGSLDDGDLLMEMKIN
ncbi:Spermidine acetyltransferase [Hyella patelloides LEGE 07179]|uniref:Spermidine acetyltransferase n=1 Tax=Hyella patelloides LEGE 07179 TaxID=945734 RepID=A0A563VNF0_9CYAN|nr:GNAT family N-acetyltransferase [Hyella patelloides]VEP12863.1 Spermidine acetyltransferase [Hyella patelloides LEGE 07179]